MCRWNKAVVVDVKMEQGGGVGCADGTMKRWWQGRWNNAVVVDVQMEQGSGGGYADGTKQW